MPALKGPAGKPSRAMRWVWLILGWIALALGLVGLALPIMPTVPFVLLAGYCFARGSKRWERWLLSRPVLGPMLHDWRENRSLPLRVKWVTTLMMAGSSIFAAWWLPVEIGWIPGACCAAVAIYIWRLPTRIQR